MLSADKILNELQEAIMSGDKERADKLRRKLLLADRDESIDEAFIEALKGKTIYRSIRKISEDKENDMSYIKCSKVVSSLITHMLIESERTGNSVKDYPIQELYIILGKFVNEDGGAVNEFREFIQERYQQFLLC